MGIVLDTYGKLKVLDTYLGEDSRQYANVRCECGRKKVVRVNNLQAGATKSCGAPQCRPDTARIAFDKDYKPYGVRSMAKKDVRTLWKLRHDTKRGLSVPQIAERLGVNVNTCHAVLRAVRRAGGLDAYLDKVA